MKYLLTSFFIFSFCWTVSAQVFFKQRVYGNEDREKNVISTLEVDNSYEIAKVKINGEKYRLYNTYTNEWKKEPIKFDKSKGRFYLENSKKAIHWRVGRRMLKDMGEKEIVGSLDRSRPFVVLGRGVQGFSIMATLTVLPLLGSDASTATLVGIGVLGGTWFGGRTLVRFVRTGVQKRLEKYNARFESPNKNFYPSFKPSSITFKPIQINPLTPSLAPTLGLAWKL